MTLRLFKSKIFLMTLLTLGLSFFLAQSLSENELPFLIAAEDERFIVGPYPDQAKLQELKSQGYTTIVSLLHPLNLPMEAFLIHKENNAIAATGLNLIRIPVRAGKTKQLAKNARIKELVNSRANGKYYVHGFKDQERVLTFLKLVDETHHSAGIARLTLSDGRVKMISPNVVIGPRPRKSEFQEDLQTHGVSGIAYAGPCNSNEALRDKHYAQAANLKWSCLQVKNSIVLSEIRYKGPWYVYGPVLPLVEGELVKRISARV